MSTFDQAKHVASAILVMGLTSISPVMAGQFYSNPPDPSLSTPESRLFITSSDNGSDFYAVTPFSSAQTPDRNLYVNSAIIVSNKDFTFGMVLQIDCGRLRYREFMAGVAFWGNSQEAINMPPETYDWQNFLKDTAFLEVGKTLCKKSASNRGIMLTGYWSK